jgi:nucleotide-binding universal stress UspA family protein
MTSTTTRNQPTHDADPRDRVVVAVDASNPSLGAALWGAAEASLLGVPLQLVCAAAYPAVRGDPESGQLDPDQLRGLESIAQKVKDTAEVLPLQLRSGPPLNTVLSHVDDRTRCLVLGHRDQDGARRLLTGSTSIAIAGRSPVPVVVVPDDWEPRRHGSAPVVVGVDLRLEGETVVGDPQVLHVAFERARDSNVPLVAVHAWEIPALLSWSPSDVQTFRARADAEFDSFLGPWRADYPEVTVDARAVAERPSDAINDASGVAQLVVVGRHTPPGRHGGFHLGSTARMVLHHLKVPAMVVPTPAGAGAEHALEPVDTWSPMY